MHALPVRTMLGNADRLLLLPAYAPYGRLDGRGTRYLRSAVIHLYRSISAITDQAELQAFETERRNYMSKVEESTVQIRMFIQNEFNENQREFDLRIGEHNNDFAARLVSLGHDTQDIHGLSDFSRRVLKKPLNACNWETVRLKLEEFVNSNKKRRLEAIYVPRNTRKLRDLFTQMFGNLPSPLAKNTFLPVLDFLQLPTVKSFIDSFASEEEFDMAVTSAFPAITQEVEAFCARMRADLVDVWIAGNGGDLTEAAKKDDTWRSSFLSLAQTVFVLDGHGSLLHYSTLFKRRILSSAAIDTSSAAIDSAAINRFNAHPNLSHNWEFYLERIQYSHAFFKLMRKTLRTYDLLGSGTIPFSELEERRDCQWMDTFCDLMNNDDGAETSDDEMD
ncbi:hypothetical protein CALVIDRAFT_134082 [Calocera viscosa TUFC12733]|uniref:Uncharacterized protein n=1 Tax=Calocera viscosa (strain TUFC12733) TaxID=1330018 RepID=A0A167LWS7_CALVF|nr:hypothetical protein CALVIDRAFT_134082 [Calocera viscosa TUFC12733]